MNKHDVAHYAIAIVLALVILGMGSHLTSVIHRQLAEHTTTSFGFAEAVRK